MNVNRKKNGKSLKNDIPIRLKSLCLGCRLARILLLIYTKGIYLKENNKLENVRSSLLFPWKSFYRK